MSSIEAIIAQARRPGGFSERKRFTLARTQAIQKLRDFALANPAGYILELIQSAVANGAQYIEVVRDDDTMTLAYLGGGISEAALSRLFDFLFAAKDRADLGYLRELAIGVNALISYNPSKIIIESGDGSPQGTVRMELYAGEDRLEIGRPDHALAGTFVRAEGLRGRGSITRERSLIETRCLAAPVPILFNNEALFGHSRQRIPALFGYAAQLTFDEGDLYGAVGLARGNKTEFALLTRGVLIEEIEHSLIPGAALGGIVCFDRLRKSADHARIVRDERLAEMWLRIRPYARALLGGNPAREALKAHTWDGTELKSVKALREFLHTARTVLAVPETLCKASPRAPAAEEIAQTLGAQILCVNPAQVSALRILGGGQVDIHVPRFDDHSTDLAFYRQAPASLPARPWLVSPISAPATTVAELVPNELNLREILGEASEVQMQVFTPAAADPHVVEVVFHSSNRELARFSQPSNFAGHVLVVELPAISPSQFGARSADKTSNAGARLAEACLRHADPMLRDAGDRLLAGLVDPEAELSPLECHRVLVALTRLAVPRLRRRVDHTGEPQPEVCLSLVGDGPPGVDLLGLRIFARPDGSHSSTRELFADINARGGWLFGSIGEPETTSSPGDIPVVCCPDATTDQLLTTLLGSGMYRPLGTSHDGNAVALDREGWAYSAQQVTAALEQGVHILAHYSPDNPNVATSSTELPPDELWLLPAAFLELARAGRLESAFDFDLDDNEANERGRSAAFIASAPLAYPELSGKLGIPLETTAAPGLVVLDENLQFQHRFETSDFGIVGVLRLRPGILWSDTRLHAVMHAIQTTTGELYNDLIARIPAMDANSPTFVRAISTLLAYAGRRVSFVGTDQPGPLQLAPVSAVARNILSMALFPGRRGVPLASLQLLRRFAATGGDRDAALAELDLAATPEVLRRWLDEVLHPQRISQASPRQVATTGDDQIHEVDHNGQLHPVDDGATHPAVDDMALATTLEYWLHHLRPDLPQDRPQDRQWAHRSRIWLATDDAPGTTKDFAELTGDERVWSLTLARDHWLVHWALATGKRDREAIAWLLLACYARVNEVFEAITNTHEQQFQCAVADTLERGRLRLVRPRMA